MGRPVLFEVLFSSPEIETWFISDWDNGFGREYRDIEVRLKREINVLLGACQDYLEDYGGSRKDAGEAIGQSGDEGIDGIIKEDRLGLDIIYIQAKRWSGTVGRPEIQKFAGALMGKGAKRGIFITTSSFTKEAVEFARIIETRIILIGGEQMANLMMDFGVGVTIVNTYQIKKLDTDYFLDE